MWELYFLVVLVLYRSKLDIFKLLDVWLSKKTPWVPGGSKLMWHPFSTNNSASSHHGSECCPTGLYSTFVPRGSVLQTVLLSVTFTCCLLRAIDEWWAHRIEECRLYKRHFYWGFLRTDLTFFFNTMKKLRVDMFEYALQSVGMTTWGLVIVA